MIKCILWTFLWFGWKHGSFKVWCWQRMPLLQFSDRSPCSYISRVWMRIPSWDNSKYRYIMFRIIFKIWIIKGFNNKMLPNLTTFRTRASPSNWVGQHIGQNIAIVENLNLQNRPNTLQFLFKWKNIHPLLIEFLYPWLKIVDVCHRMEVLNDRQVVFPAETKEKIIFLA